MYDSFNREITYLRISVTDRCNLACRYCMPELLPRPAGGNGLLEFEEIVEVVQTLAPEGISKIRLTGGEPLVRKGVDALVGMISGIDGIREITMTTNGQLLSGMAARLAKAGLDRVNISLDTLDPERYREITRGGDIRRVLKGIDAALEAGLDPVKINCVLMPETTGEEISRAERIQPVLRGGAKIYPSDEPGGGKILEGGRWGRGAVQPVQQDQTHRRWPLHSLFIQ